jgi:CRP/FNR family transcriptional regulator, cyclic AMP receptor protein
MKQVDFDQDARETFSFLSDGDLAALEPELVPVELAAGETLFRSGEVSSSVYFLVSGRLAVRKKTGFAEKMQVVALLDPGAPVGEGAVFSGQVHEATVVAIEKSRLLALAGTSLEILKEHNPSLAWKIATRLFYVSHLRLRKTSDRLALVL